MKSKTRTMDSLGRRYGYLFGNHAERSRKLAGIGDHGRGSRLVHGCAQHPFQTTIRIEHTMTTLHAIWWKIYPNDDRHRWMPLIWLPFMIWFFVDPASRHTGPLGWVANTVFGLVFILLYLQAFSRPEPVPVDVRSGHDRHGGNPHPTQRRRHGISRLRSGCGRFPSQPAQSVPVDRPSRSPFSASTPTGFICP